MIGSLPRFNKGLANTYMFVALVSPRLRFCDFILREYIL